MKRLTLHLKAEYFEAIRTGQKVEEYRSIGTYWDKRLDPVLVSYDEIHLLCGYPASHIGARRLVFPWRGAMRKKITHPLFGTGQVEVWSIPLHKPLA